MNLREIYNMMGGDYDDVLERLMSEERIVKYLNKFKENTDYADLVRTLGDKDFETAFRHSHNLKGMCLNLGMTQLYQSSSALCEILRCGAPAIDTTPLLNDVKRDYDRVIDAINAI